MLFTSAARGYKAGGANIATFIEPGDPLTYKDETLWNFEAGLRSSWFDDTVISQLTAFYLYREDVQLRDSGGAGGFYHYYTDNYDSAEHYGLEAESTWFINRNWSTSAGLGLLQTKNNASNTEHNDLANAPAYTYNFAINYQADGGFFANVEVVGSDEYYESNSHNEKRDAFAVVNSSIGYRYQNWTITLWAKNLFDQEYEKRVFYFANDAPAFTDTKRFEDPADPQQFGITANYTW